MGLVLNRASNVRAVEAVPEFQPLLAADDPVYVGGPVQREAVVALAEFEDVDDAAAIVFATIGVVAADADLALLAGAIRRSRVFAGYAGWGPGQLEAELGEPAWIVAPAESDDIFKAVDDLWSAVLRRKRGPYALLATMPPDPTLN